MIADRSDGLRTSVGRTCSRSGGECLFSQARGALYTAATRVPTKRPEQPVIRARERTFVGDITAPQPSGRRLWCETARRGVLAAAEVMIIGARAPWIWHLAAEQSPDAVQIVDWYRATRYIRGLARAVYGEGTFLARRWARARLDELWDGQVEEAWPPSRPTAASASRCRRRSPTTPTIARACGTPSTGRAIQIGGGPVESRCQQIIGVRLKQAGIIGNVDGARAVAAVRA